MSRLSGHEVDLAITPDLVPPVKDRARVEVGLALFMFNEGATHEHPGVLFRPSRHEGQVLHCVVRGGPVVSVSRAHPEVLWENENLDPGLPIMLSFGIGNAGTGLRLMNADDQVFHNPSWVNGVDAPLGRYELHVPSDMVSRTLGKRTLMSKSWFIVACLAGALPVEAAPPSQVKVETIRHIPVTFVTDSYFRQLPNWRGLAQSALSLATEDLEQQVGLKFDLAGEGSWQVPDSVSSLAGALRSATLSFPGQSGILAVLLGPREQKIPGAELGFAFLGRPALLVVAASGSGQGQKQDLAMLIRHELGHVFGIPHLDDGRTIMNPVPDARAWEFGELGIEVLRANRRMKFTALDPLAGSDLASLRDVYTLLDERGQMEPILWLHLARSFELRGDIEAGEDVYEAALKRDRGSVGARLGIARCAATRQDTTKVLVLAHALRWMELNPRQLADLGSLWIQVHEFAAAESTLSKVVAWDPLPDDWFNLGLARFQLKNSDGAAQAFQRYLETDPKGARREEALRYLQAQSTR